MATTEGFHQSNTCVNHPERMAVEHCEVCNSPLCAYCLYYTSDGQRLCKTHADQAAAGGAFIRAPGVYADALVPAQLSAARETSDSNGPKPQYQGNSMDLFAFLGLILGVASILNVFTCFAASCLMLPIGLLASIAALVRGKDAFDKSRTRWMAIVGVLGSGLGLLIVIGGFAAYVGLIATAFSTISTTGPISVRTIQFTVPTNTPTPRPTRTPESNLKRTNTPRPTLTPEITDTPESPL